MATPRKPKTTYLYASGRTRPQGGGPALIEGTVLYTSPQGAERIRQALARSPGLGRRQHGALACAAAGAMSYEIELLAAEGLFITAIVVDGELRENPVPTPEAEARKVARRGTRVAVPKQRDYAEKGRRQREAARARRLASQAALPSLGSEA